jgi:hypothetical protein
VKDYLEYFEKNKIIFIHLPKCAGTSIVRNFDIPNTGHITLERFIQLFGSLENFYIFTFVRNPITRFLSAFNYLSYGGRNEEDKNWKSKFNIDRHNYKNVLNIIEKNIVDGELPHHFKTQTYYLKEKQTKKFDRKNINFIGKYENLDSDFKRLCKNIGREYKPLGSENITKLSQNNLLLSHLDTSDLLLLKKIYYEDFINFYYDGLVNKLRFQSNKLEKLN